MSYEINKVDFRHEDAKEQFVESLKNTGFAIIYNHSIDSQLIDDVYEEWAQFFDSEYKYNYMFDLEKQDGYFPIKSENAKGYNTKDLKEFYHIYLPWGRIPEEISENTIKIRNKLVDIGTILLKSPKNLIFRSYKKKSSFTMPIMPTRRLFLVPATVFSPFPNWIIDHWMVKRLGQLLNACSRHGAKKWA